MWDKDANFFRGAYSRKCFTDLIIYQHFQELSAVKIIYFIDIKSIFSQNKIFQNAPKKRTLKDLAYMGHYNEKTKIHTNFKQNIECQNCCDYKTKINRLKNL